MVLALLEEMEAEPAASAVAFAAVLDRADSLRKAGEAPELGEETYRAAVRSLSPFTRLLGTETTLWQEEPLPGLRIWLRLTASGVTAPCRSC